MTDDRVLDIKPVIAERGSGWPAHPPAVRELAFLCWIQSDGNIELASNMMHRMCRDADPHDDLPHPDDLPNVRTLYRWHKADAWDAKMVAVVGEHFPQILARQNARLLLLTDQAISVYAASLHNTEKVSLVRANVARDVLLLRGLGTAGSRGGLPVIPPALPDHDPAQERLSPTESLRRMLEEDAKQGTR